MIFGNHYNPRRVRAFAVSEGIKAKTDPIDAIVLRRFAQEKNLQPSKAPSKVQKELAAYLDQRSQLNDHLVKEKNRLDKSDESILPSIKSMIDNINQQINQIELAIRELIKSHAGNRRRWGGDNLDNSCIHAGNHRTKPQSSSGYGRCSPL